MTKPVHPSYAPITGDVIVPPPYLLQGALFFNFLFDSSYEALQKVCDQWFNDPSDNEVHFQPLLPYVMVSYSSYKSDHSAVPPYNQYGQIPYNELMFSFFVVRLKKKLGVWFAEHIYAFVPYVLVDNHIPMVAGRALLGMPKLYGKIELPQDPKSNNLSFDSSMFTIKEFGPKSVGAWQWLAKVEQKTASNTADGKIWTTMEEAFSDIGKLMFEDGKIILPGLGLLVEVEEFLKGELPFVSLKQFRSDEFAGKACYQSICSFHAKTDGFSGGGILPGEFELQLNHSDLYPVAESLGLKQEGNIARAAFWLDWGFYFNIGKVLWQPGQQKSNLLSNILHFINRLIHPLNGK